MWIQVRGERWSLRTAEGLGRKDLGECAYAERIIRAPIDGDQPDELDTIIHELLHACYPDLSEDAVIEGANTIAAALLKLNWRKNR